MRKEKSQGIRHDAPKKIVGGEKECIMTRNKFKGTCFVSEFEPRAVKDVLEN